VKKVSARLTQDAIVFPRMSVSQGERKIPQSEIGLVQTGLQCYFSLKKHPGDDI
jgi:hypothetical protein